MPQKLAVRWPVWASLSLSGVVLAGLALGLAGCADPSQQVVKQENLLRQAGFGVIRPVTPEQQDEFAKSHAGQFVRRTIDGQPRIIMGDPEVCNCSFVGDEAAWQRYKAMRAHDGQTDRPQLASDMSYFSNPGINWNSFVWGAGH